MKPRIIALLTALSMAMTLGCDDPEEADDAEEEEVEETEEDEEVEEDEEEDTEEEEEAADDDEEAATADDDDADAVEVAVAEDGKITIRATQSGFEPSAIEAPTGEELTLEFVRDIEETCMDNVKFSALDLHEDIPLDEALTVTVTPEEGDAIEFACDHGMGKSTITGT